MTTDIEELNRIWHDRLSAAEGERMKQEARAEGAEANYVAAIANGIDESARADKAEDRFYFWAIVSGIGAVAGLVIGFGLGMLASAG